MVLDMDGATTPRRFGETTMTLEFRQCLEVTPKETFSVRMPGKGGRVRTFKAGVVYWVSSCSTEIKRGVVEVCTRSQCKGNGTPFTPDLAGQVFEAVA